ncbi:unnamed protein product [Closterium sp. Naga37s-1]|nr:unnamed protein product [Closterium sp. Naga37s-1]
MVGKPARLRSGRIPTGGEGDSIRNDYGDASGEQGGMMPGELVESIETFIRHHADLADDSVTALANVAYFLFAMSELTHHPLAPHIPRGLRQSMAQVVRSSKEGLLVWRAASLLALTESSGGNEVRARGGGRGAGSKVELLVWRADSLLALTEAFGGKEVREEGWRGSESLAGLFSAAAKAVTAMQQGSSDADDADVEADVDADVKADVDAGRGGEKISEEATEVEGGTKEEKQAEGEQKEEEAARKDQHVSEGRSEGVEREEDVKERGEEEGVEEVRVSRGAGRGRGKKRRGRGGRAGAAGRRVRGKRAAEGEKGENEGRVSGGADDGGVSEVEMVGEGGDDEVLEVSGSEIEEVTGSVVESGAVQCSALEVEESRDVKECVEVKEGEKTKECEKVKETAEMKEIEEVNGDEEVEECVEVKESEEGVEMVKDAAEVISSCNQRVAAGRSGEVSLVKVAPGAGSSVQPVTTRVLRSQDNREVSSAVERDAGGSHGGAVAGGTEAYGKGDGGVGKKAGRAEDAEQEEAAADEALCQSLASCRLLLLIIDALLRDFHHHRHTLLTTREYSCPVCLPPHHPRLLLLIIDALLRDFHHHRHKLLVTREHSFLPLRNRGRGFQWVEQLWESVVVLTHALASPPPSLFGLARAAQLLLGAVLDLHGIIADNDGYRRARNEKEALEDRLVRLFALEPSVAKKSFFMQVGREELLHAGGEGRASSCRWGGKSFFMQVGREELLHAGGEGRASSCRWGGKSFFMQVGREEILHAGGEGRASSCRWGGKSFFMQVGREELLHAGGEGRASSCRWGGKSFFMQVGREELLHAGGEGRASSCRWGGKSFFMQVGREELLHAGGEGRASSCRWGGKSFFLQVGREELLHAGGEGRASSCRWGGKSFFLQVGRVHVH